MTKLLETVATDRRVLAAIAWEPERLGTVLKTQVLLIMSDSRAKDAPPRAFLVGEELMIVSALARSQFMHLIDCGAGSSPAMTFGSSRLVFASDPSIDGAWQALKELSAGDRLMKILFYGVAALNAVEQAHSLAANDRLDAYLTAIRSLKCIAYIEVLSRGLVPDASVIDQAATTNPAVFADPLHSPAESHSTQELIRRVDHYLSSEASSIFRPLLEYLSDMRVLVSASQLDAHFQRRHGLDAVHGACLWLARKGLVIQSTITSPLAIGAKSQAEELAFAGVQT